MRFTDFNVSTRRVLAGIWAGGVVSVAGLVGLQILRGDAVELGLPVVAFIAFTTLA